MKTKLLFLIHSFLLSLDRFSETTLQNWIQAVEKRLPEMTENEIKKAGF